MKQGIDNKDGQLDQSSATTIYSRQGDSVDDADSEDEWQQLVDVTVRQDSNAEQDRLPGQMLTAGYLVTDAMFVSKVMHRLQSALRQTGEGLIEGGPRLSQVLKVVTCLLCSKWLVVSCLCIYIHD